MVHLQLYNYYEQSVEVVIQPAERRFVIATATGSLANDLTGGDALPMFPALGIGIRISDPRESGVKSLG